MGTVEVVAALAVFRVLAGTVLHMILRTVSNLLLMDSYGAMAVGTPYVFAALADRFRNRDFLPAPLVLVVNLVLSSALTNGH